MQEKFTTSSRRDLREYFSFKAKKIKRAYAGEPPLAGIWVIKEISPGHSIVLHNENIVTSDRIQDENSLILIEEILSQFKSGEQTFEKFKLKIAALTNAFEGITSRFEENSKKLMEAGAIAIIQLTLVQNCIKEIEKLSSDLDHALKEMPASIDCHQEAINKCYILFFGSSTNVIDSTLKEKIPSEKEKGRPLQKDISQFKKELFKKQDLLREAKPDSPVLTRIPPEYEDIQDVIAALCEIETIYDRADDRVQLHQVKNLDDYIKNIILALKNPEASDLFKPLINYRQERLDAISALIAQLALALILKESPEKVTLLCRWIEICRGKPPKERLFNNELFVSKAFTSIYQDPVQKRLNDDIIAWIDQQLTLTWDLEEPPEIEIFRGESPKESIFNYELFDSKALASIHQDLVLKEIYFNLPRVLQYDLSDKAEFRAQKTNVIDSTHSIDDPNLSADQISQQWCRFIDKERSEFKGVERPSSLELMYRLNNDIKNSEKEELETIVFWKQQLRAAYKLYQTEQGIPSEDRLLTQEPLTEEEYKLIQSHPIFSNIFRGLNNAVQEELRQEQYKSILLSVVGGSQDTTGAPINTNGILEHTRGATTELLLEEGEFEFGRGFRYLIFGEFLRNKFKHETGQKLAGILMEKDFTQNEANSIIGFMGEQKFYYIFFNFLAARANAIKGKIYNVNKESPTYVNIYKLNGKVYFEVKSGPWSFVRMDDIFYMPEQPGKIIEGKKTEEKIIENFYDAEFTLYYELVQGKDIPDDVLRLVKVIPANQVSWQLLNFDSSEWKVLPVTKRYLINIDLTMLDLSAADSLKQKEAKIKIKQWLSNKSNYFHLKDYRDYEFIQLHLQSIRNVYVLSCSLGTGWLEKSLRLCAEKIDLYKPQENEFGGKNLKPLLSELSIAAPFDEQVVLSELLSGIQNRVDQAKGIIERVLNPENISPTLIQCQELLRILSLIKTKRILKDLAPSEEEIAAALIQKQQELIGNDWLEVQITACNKYIADANAEAFSVARVIPELKDKDTRLEAMEKINVFLNGSIQDQAKRKNLVAELIIYNSELQIRNDEDPNFSLWLSNAASAAVSRSPDSKAKLLSSSGLITRKIHREMATVSSSSSLLERERQTTFSSSSSNRRASASSSSVSGSSEPPKAGSPFFWQQISEELSVKLSKGLARVNSKDTDRSDNKKGQSPPKLGFM